jgi:hypothetical protein
MKILEIAKSTATKLTTEQKKELVQFILDSDDKIEKGLFVGAIPNSNICPHCKKTIN